MADQKQNPKTAQKHLTPFQEYLYANLLWWAFLAVLAVISFFTCGGVWDDIASGVIQFIFVIMGGGFTLVSILDYLYEEHFARISPGGKK